jgi:patatin-like phospholipase/acyl hydrolase
LGDFVRKFFILSIDGGGIRGVIPAVFLSRLKDLLEEKGLQKPFHKIFDLMAGTSTGGLIALALSAPLFSTDGMLYHKEGGVIPQILPELYEETGFSRETGSR